MHQPDLQHRPVNQHLHPLISQEELLLATIDRQSTGSDRHVVTSPSTRQSTGSSASSRPSTTSSTSQSKGSSSSAPDQVLLHLHPDQVQRDHPVL